MTEDDKTANADARLRDLRRLRQTRRFTEDEVTDDDIARILDVARWSGSAGNSQPWEFILVRDRETLEQLSVIGPSAQFIGKAPLVVAIVLAGANPRSEAYDEGRVSERIMLAGQALGLGSGTAWWGSEEFAAQAKEILGVPADKALLSCVALGYPQAVQRKPQAGQGRRPLAELVFDGTYGQPWQPASR
jgi:nitroreductase